MEEDQEYGALVPVCDVFQEEVPLDPARRTRRCGAGGEAEQWKLVSGLCWPALLWLLHECPGLQLIESWSHLGWTRPLRSSATFSPAPPCPLLSVPGAIQAL